VNVVFLIAASHHSFRHADASVLPDNGPEAARPDETLEPNIAADEKQPNYATADAEVAVRSEHSGVLKGNHPSPSVPSIPHDGKPDGT